MLLLFVVLPSLYYFKLIPIHFIISMAVLAMGAAIWLYRHHLFNNRSFGLHGFRAWHKVFWPWLLFVVASTLFVYFATPGKFFIILRQKPLLWVAIMCFYPIFSAYPQELLFRGFFIERYQCLFKKDWVLVIVNGTLFGMAHLMFGHWVSVILAGIGGMLFAMLYLQHRSILASTIVHSLFGNWIFTVGLGQYFYLQHGH